MKSAIQTEGLRKKFGRTLALDGVDLNVPEGAIYALVGPNGAGKTTVIKLLMNIFRPTAGWAKVLGSDTARLMGSGFQSIGYVSENQDQPEWMTVGALLNYLRPFYPTWDRELERQLVEQFDLPLGRRIRHLSRGMKMKAAFLSALAYRPTLIILDEPFTGLDPLVRDELIEGLLDRASETTIFLSSHDLAEIESFASHVGYLDRGRMLFSEEMNSLSARFREVTITFDGPVAIPENPPAGWLQFEVAGPLVRFIHSGFCGESSQREIAVAFPAARDIALDPMPLRAIFLAVAKAGRSRALTTPRPEVTERVEA
jgi:ABC-2 type transport system ATP-binding protein